MKRNSIAILLAIFYTFIFVSPAYAENQQIEDELIYKIIVDRFNNVDHSIDTEVDLEDPFAYHGGDFAGIQSELEGISSMGVTAITLSPIMENADNGYHGYWIEDFTSLEESFGSLEDLEELIQTAHAYDIKVIPEFVTNYVHESHPIATDPERDDWILTDEVDGPAWTDEVVQLNQENPEVQDYLTEAAMFWLEETDIDGLMLHAVDQSSVSFIDTLATTLKEAHEGIYVLGDILDPTEDVIEDLQETELDAIDNYTFSQTISEVFSDVDQSPEELHELAEDVAESTDMIFVDDQYTKRFTQKFSENQRNSLTAWTLALTYMYTSPGTPVLLQGSEHSMYGEDAEESQRLVPLFSGDPELVEFFERIGSMFDEFPALKVGDYEFIDSNDSMVVYKRETDEDTLYIAINNGSESSHVDIPGIESGKMLRGHLADNIARENEEGNYRVGIPRESVEVYELTEDVGINWVLIGVVAAILLGFVVIVIVLSRKQKIRESKE